MLSAIQTLINALQTSPTVFITFVTIIGLVIGSFLNVVVYRLPRILQQQWFSECRDFLKLPNEKSFAEFNLMLPKSHCPHCEAPLKPWHNIPLLSYLFLRGKCAFCHRAIAWRYPLLECVCAIASGLCAWRFGFSAQTAAALIFTWSLLALTWIDWEHQILPDEIVLPVLWFGLLLSLSSVFINATHAILGAVLAYLVLWSIATAFRLITHKDGMGHGDFKLFAMIGAWTGFENLPFVILLASVLGSIFGGAMLLIRKHSRYTPIPFGPYLAFAGFIALLWHQHLFQFSLMGLTYAI